VGLQLAMKGMQMPSTVVEVVANLLNNDPLGSAINRGFAVVVEAGKGQ
jgi:hypothetical protein